MSDSELLLTMAGAITAVWLSLYVALLIWASRRTARRARRELALISRAIRSRTRGALFDGIGAFARFGLLFTTAMVIAPVLVTIGPLLLAVAGLDLTVHVVHVSH